ncbi:MAG: 2OG-Fe(II) oxygenase [Burkholderiaceae bacterium]|jgi:hypothetical protein|nr:2OG-Fe(II) oxygenase [Burkholderiaceae bacterium]
MTTDIVRALTKIQAGEKESSAFCSEHALDAQALRVCVDGIGVLPAPLDRAHIEALIAASTPAHFGRREKTLLDKSVRNTGEIGLDRLQVEIDEQVLAALLAKAGRTMGLPTQSRLVAHLHNLLIYGPGQFFKPHQDSEKIQDMLATMVVALPSPHIGGDLTITHGEEVHRFKTENLDATAPRCIVFYADCRHEVELVRQGYRVALTYNLALESNGLRDEVQRNPALEAALRAYFADDDPAAKADEPRKLAWFLDHSYTEHGLSWPLLKGDDRCRALALHDAARELDLTVHLALAEIHESWDALGDEDDPEPNELIEDDISVIQWIDADGKRLRHKEIQLSDEEICYATDMQDEHLFDSEFEGWMGNSGNTVDYWYRRAAVVLWPRSRQIAMDFELDYDAALARLVELGQPSNASVQLAQSVRDAGAALHRFPSYEALPQYFKHLANIAARVKDAALARSILSPLTIAVLTSANAAALAELQTTYGVPWCLHLIDDWRQSEATRWRGWRPEPDENDLPALVRAYLAREIDAGIVALPLERCVERIILMDGRSISATPKQKAASLSARIKTFAAALDAHLLFGKDALTEKLVRHALDHRDLYPAAEIAETLLDLPDECQRAPVQALREYAQNGLAQELARGERARDDWSLSFQALCTCKVCAPALAFLASPTQTRDAWPLAEYSRDHLQEQLTALDLPLAFETIKRGRPYTLAVGKCEELFAQAHQRYMRVAALAQRLKESA